MRNQRLKSNDIEDGANMVSKRFATGLEAPKVVLMPSNRVPIRLAIRTLFRLESTNPHHQ